MFGTYGQRRLAPGLGSVHGGCMRIDSSMCRAVGGLCAAGLAAALVVGCNSASGDRPRTLPPVTSTSTPTSTADALERELVRVYRGYLDSIPAAEDATGKERQRILKQWMTDPLLTRVLDNMAAAQAAGRRAYGKTPFKVDDVMSASTTATLTICQDGSNSGVQDARTGKRINRGLPNTPYVIKYRQIGDQSWRMTDIASPPGEC